MSEEEGLFRSASMSLIQLYIPSESVHATVTELGELGNVHTHLHKRHIQLHALSPGDVLHITPP